jgi:nucleoside 2-deoxyribosyltransferase
MKEKIYLSGPMTGLENNNKEEFEKARYLLHNVYEIVSPVDIAVKVESIYESPCYEDYMRADILHLLDCDCIYMLPGWKKSRGAKLEHKIATSIGLKKYGYIKG